jgi:hypothetical protein
MTNDWNGVLKHAEDELSLVNMKDIPLGKAMLELLKQSIEETRDPSMMKRFVGMVSGFVDKKLLSPVTEEDFEAVPTRESGRDILKCKRSEHIFKDVEENKYYDNRAIAYLDTNKPEHLMYLYTNAHRSIREIKLPYMPQYTIEYLK